MKPIWIEKTKPEEIPEATAWIKRLAERNNIDWSVLMYPATTLIKATDGERNLLHVPIQPVFMLESLGISPDASPLETAKSLYGVMQIVRWESLKAGHGEAYFLCRDEQTVKFAEHNGMERMNFPLFRFKVSQ